MDAWLLMKQKLARMILDTGIASADDIARFQSTRTDGQTLSSYLLSSGKVKEIELKKLEAYVLGIPFVTLDKERLERDVLFLIPEAIARRYNAVAYKRNGTNLEIAVLDIDNLPAIDFIRKKTGLRILPRLTDSDSIKAVLLQYKKSLQAEFDSIIQKESASLQK